MKKKYTSMRILRKTQHLLKIVSSVLDESVLDVVDRLVAAEFNRLKEAGLTLPELGDGNE